jgi:hypothetical protein
MGPALVIEREIALQAFPCMRNRVVGMQVHFFVLHAFPKPFDKHIVDPAAFAIHAELDAVALNQVDEFRAGELTALIGVKDLRLAIALKGFRDGLEAEVRRQAVGQSPARVGRNSFSVLRRWEALFMRRNTGVPYCALHVLEHC